MPHPRLLRALVAGAAVTSLVALGGPTAADASARTPNGRIAFTANLHGSWQVFTMRPNGSSIHQVTHLAKSTDINLQQNWSPDGNRLAFSSTKSGNADIYTINADGSGLRQVTTSAGDDIFPAWSPDGAHFVFAHSDNFATAAIWTMNADGSHRRRLTSPAFDSFLPMYTPNGRHIVFTSSRGGLVAAVWIMNADGSHARRLTPARFEGAVWDVSPDGRHLLVGNHANVNFPTSLWRMDLDGTHLRRLTDAGCCFHDSNARYSPDGQTIAFTTNRSFAGRGLREAEIWEMRADGAGKHPVTSSLTLGGCPDGLVDNCVGAVDWAARAG